MDKLLKQEKPETVIIVILPSFLTYPLLKLDSREHGFLGMFLCVEET
jgi:hypothetical protein